MPYNARVLKVMIASPGDVAAERRTVRDVVTEWNHIHSEDRGLVLMPIGWETHSAPTMGDRPQAIINKQILVNCDLLVAVFWTRIGSPTGVAVSGTVEEIQEHINAGKPAMIYFSSAPVRADSVDEAQYAALKEFKQEIYKTGLVESYDSLGEFGDKFFRQLTQTIIRTYPITTASATLTATTPLPQPPATPAMCDEAKELLEASASDPSGRLMRIRHLGGLIVQASGRNFSKEGDARSETRWEGVIRELEGLGFIEDRGYKREVFAVTDEGFRIADLLRSSQP
ncbi:MAG: DUF4062 domain-containing protein [Planctomycetia bacterium]